MNWYLIAPIPVLGYFAYVYGKRYIMYKVNEELDRRMKKEDDEEIFKPAEKSKSAIIKVTHGGKSHHVYVPYDRSKSSSMLRKRVFLIRDGHKIDLTQKPGIPYLVSAEHLSGSHIIVEDLSGEVIKTYESTDIPGYI